MLEAAGYKVASCPAVVRYPGVRAVREALGHLKRHRSSIGMKQRVATVDEYFSAVDLEGHLEMEQRLLRPFQGNRAR